MASVFALRLRQYANRLDSILGAIQRTADLDDEEYSPSAYTPSRRQSLIDLEKLKVIIQGYCLAVDDTCGLEHGTTLSKFYCAMKRKVHLTPEYEYPQSDSGYPPDIYYEMEAKADKAFEEAIFEDDSI